ncbi:MAG TPA: Fe-S cluster assembly protein SufD [Burkholderiaceae bacterium]|nr:Fe-S cluster assembly protein SufD [Burkholderiaceae bacterium]
MMNKDHCRTQFAQLESHLVGASLPWLRRMRARSFERFAELGLPTLRDEDWKYTSVASLEKHAFKYVPESIDGVSANEVDKFALATSHLLVFVNGRHAPELSRLGSLPRGAEVGSLAVAITDRPDRFEALFARDAEGLVNGFTALNAAFWNDGAHVDLAPGCVVEEPIHLLFISTDADLAVHPRNIIRAGAGSQADIVEHYVSLNDAAYLTNAVTHIRADAGAAIIHSKLQQEGPRGHHIADIRAEQSLDTRFTSQSFALGGLLSRNDIATRLDAPGCEATLIGLYMASGRQHMDHHTRVDHLQPLGVSREVYKGVLDGASRAVFNGKVVVHPDAQRTDAQQSNRNLLLSENAEVDTKPQLEIYADDVKCSHGATVGQLDAEQVYYLRSRGMDDAQARALLTFAFAADIATRVSCAPLRARLDQLLRGRLPQQMSEQVKELP